MNEDGAVGTSDREPPDSDGYWSQHRPPRLLGFTDLNGDDGRIRADLTVTHSGEDRVTRSVEAYLAEVEPRWGATELRTSTLMFELIGLRGIVDVWRLEEEPPG